MFSTQQLPDAPDTEDDMRAPDGTDDPVIMRLKTEQAIKELQKINDLKEGRPVSAEAARSLGKAAEQVANYALNFVPGGDLALCL